MVYLGDGWVIMDNDRDMDGAVWLLVTFVGCVILECIAYCSFRYIVLRIVLWFEPSVKVKRRTGRMQEKRKKKRTNKDKHKERKYWPKCSCCRCVNRLGQVFLRKIILLLDFECCWIAFSLLLESKFHSSLHHRKGTTDIEATQQYSNQSRSYILLSPPFGAQASPTIPYSHRFCSPCGYKKVFDLQSNTNEIFGGPTENDFTNAHLREGWKKRDQTCSRTAKTRLIAWSARSTRVCLYFKDIKTTIRRHQKRK